MKRLLERKMQSLHSFAKENRLSKATVHRRAKALGIDTSQGLTSDAILTLRREFQLHQSPQVVEGEIVGDSAALSVVDNAGVPPIPRWDVGGQQDSKDVARIRQTQGQQNLQTFLSAATGNYMAYKMQQHFAGIDAAFANTTMGTAGIANQVIQEDFQ
jgi:hypothetical protein